MDNSSWHEDQSMFEKEQIEKKRKVEAERDEILNTNDWIEVPKYYEVDPNKEDVDWKEEYQKLMEHHKKETQFLINKIRKIVKKYVTT